MVAYTGIQGQNILIVNSDPANPVEGQIWYNTTSNLLKGYTYVATGSWASGGNVNTARQSPGGAGANSSSFIFFGGYTTAYLGTSESYNGTSWTPTPSLNTARNQLGGAGTQTAALGFGGTNGSNLTATEIWNGSSWTSNPTGLNTGRRALGGTGTQTAGLAVGGADTNPQGNAVESWGGSSWTSVTSLNVGQRSGVAGTQTAAITTAVGTVGMPGPGAAVTQTWNGSVWTSLPAAPFPTSAPGLGDLSIFGTSTQALATAGSDFSTNVTYAPSAIFNGSTWTSSTALPTARGSAGSSGGSSFSDSLLASGVAGAPSYSLLNSTVEWVGPGFSTKTLTTS
jgi:hypothetical protein